jgi:hypothetical protein
MLHVWIYATLNKILQGGEIMKKWLYISTFALCLMFSQNGYAQDSYQKAPVAPTAAPMTPKSGQPANNAVAPKAGQPAMAPNANANTNVNANVNANAPKPGQPGYDNQRDGRYGYDNQRDGQHAANNQGSNGQCPVDHPCEDQQLNDCWCLMVHYEPRHYQTQKCVEECIPCTKKCWRKVPQCYDVQKCKMVPEYYSETCTKYVNECYEVDDVKKCKKMVCVEECVPCKKKCWRKVPQCYEVQN